MSYPMWLGTRAAISQIDLIARRDADPTVSTRKVPERDVESQRSSLMNGKPLRCGPWSGPESSARSERIFAAQRSVLFHSLPAVGDTIQLAVVTG